MPPCMVSDPLPDKKRHDSTIIGLISDSHGDVKSLSTALIYLTEKKCRAIFHLGDICDSLQPETADACVELLKDYEVKGIKGNNDHSLVVNQDGQSDGPIKPGTLQYLKRLPLVTHSDRALLTHSLPFEKEMGLSCMIGNMDRHRALNFFQNHPDQILFRGHSHSPEITWRNRGGGIHSEKVGKDRTVMLNERIPCIVTCGALDMGYCMIWSPAENRVTCIRR